MEDISSIIADIVIDWTDELIQDMRQDLNDKVKSKRKSLAQSIEPSFTINSKGITMDLNLNDYYDFVDKGVNGVQGNVGSPYSYKYARPSMSHAKAVAQWITDAGIEFKGRGSNNWAKARLSAGYAMAMAAKRKGLKAKPFFDKNINEARIEDLAQRIADATGQEIELRLLS